MIKLEAWACFNKGEAPNDVHEISFENTKENAERCWKGQEIRKCIIKIESDGVVYRAG